MKQTSLLCGIPSYTSENKEEKEVKFEEAEIETRILVVKETCSVTEIGKKLTNVYICVQDSAV